MLHSNLSTPELKELALDAAEITDHARNLRLISREDAGVIIDHLKKGNTISTDPTGRLLLATGIDRVSKMMTLVTQKCASADAGRERETELLLKARELLKVLQQQNVNIQPFIYTKT